jgi:hypothetical protein
LESHYAEAYDLATTRRLGTYIGSDGQRESQLKWGVIMMKNETRVKVQVLLTGLFIFFLMGSFSMPAFAQSQTFGAINGVITDPNADVVADATVTVTNEGTNAAVSTKSDSVGAYVISNLQPGIYDVETTVTGFGPYKQTGVKVEVGLSTSVYVRLALAGQLATVTVTSETPVINTEQSVFATNFDDTQLANLPINVRRWSGLALMTPGAVPDGTFGDVSFRGVGYMFDSNTVDGGSNTQAFFAEEVGRTRMAYSTSMLSVQDFQVTDSNYSAEFGRAVGGVINAVTKSGTNSIHGDAYYYLRDSTIGGAYAPFATGAVLQPGGGFLTEPIKPLDIRDQFGADAGGAIIKDKLFWYFDFDDQRRDFPAVNIPSTPGNFFPAITVAAPDPNFPLQSCTNATQSGSASTTPKIPMGVILYCRFSSAYEGSQSISTIQNEVTAAQAFLTSTTGVSPRQGNQTIFFPKIDWKPDANNTITGSYNNVRWTSPFGVQTGSVVARSIDSNGNDYVDDDRATVNWSDLISSSMSNNLRFVFSRDYEFEHPTPSLKGEPLAPQTGFSPQVDINSCGFGNPPTGSTTPTTLACSWTLGTPYYLDRQDYPDEKRYQVADTLTLTKGKHLLKFGADVNYVRDLLSAYASGDQYGEYSYSQLEDFLSDYMVLANNLPSPACTSALSGTTYNIPCYNDYFQTFGPLSFNVPTIEVGLFAQDDWHVLPRLTLNLGLRWDHEKLPSPVLPNAAIPATTAFPSDRKDFGPRIGFAYDITGDGKTVFRGGAGVYYGRITNEQIYEEMTQTGSPLSQLSPTIFPTTGSSNATGMPTPGEPIYPNILTTFNASVGTPNIAYFPSDMRLPGAEEFDAVLERQIAKNTALSVSYIGSIGRFLPIGINTNLNAPGTLNYTIVGGPLNGNILAEPFFSGTKPNPAYNYMVMYCSCGTSHYNGLVVQLNRRMTSGLQVNMSYTFANDTDDVASGTGASGGEATSPAISGTGNGPINPFNPALENGTSNLEVKHRLVGTLVWQPPYFEHSSNSALRWGASGWIFSLNQTAESGLPYIQTISGNEPSGLGATISSGGPSGGATSTRFLEVPKNTNFLPATVNTDIRVGRTFRAGERFLTELSFEVFNVANHVNYTGVTGTAYTTGGTSTAPVLNYSSSFGHLTAASNGVYLTQRQMQLGAKISF